MLLLWYKGVKLGRPGICEYAKSQIHALVCHNSLARPAIVFLIADIIWNYHGLVIPVGFPIVVYLIVILPTFQGHVNELHWTCLNTQTEFLLFTSGMSVVVSPINTCVSSTSSKLLGIIMCMCMYTQVQAKEVLSNAHWNMENSSTQ